MNLGAFYSRRADAAFADGIVVLWTLILLNVFGFSGCRSLANRTTNTKLVSARQLSLRGADALQRSRPQDAELLFAEALQHSPLDERAHWGYASTLWKRGERERAVKHMKEALRLSGRNPDYAIRLGEMQLDMGDRNAARESALSVLSANRSHADAWALLGDTHHSERDWAAALECYQQALLRRGDFPRVQLSVAEIYRNMDRPQRSLAVLDHMNDLHATSDDTPESLMLRGLALADLDRRDEASQALALASERMPIDQTDKYVQIVQAQQRIGELVAARVTLGKLIATNNAPELLRLQSTLDASFANMAATSPPKNRPQRKPENEDAGGRMASRPDGPGGLSPSQPPTPDSTNSRSLLR